ncbi:hypothetical protein BOX15_Mlig003120g3 [Macrostomum lignano]|uniref:Amiloride-sensitive sodium channel n=1 Tax=Macrostomum lignano TaxID=282301 RepID=A0A267G3Q5_9PLAT|nr:hypothetical protein BOX15_Mlig003120g3 [Macrostomum lignano]
MATNSSEKRQSAGNSRPNKLSKMVEKMRRDGFGESPSKKLLKQFCESTSAHGFHKIFQGSSILHRIVWLLIIITAFSGFSAHLISLFSRFNEGPVNTEISVYSTNFVFPDISICATSHFSLRRYERNPKIRSLNKPIKELVSDIRSFWDPNNESDSEINGDLLNSLKSYLHEVNITKQSQEMILHCDFAGTICSYINFTEYIDPNYFSCFTFSPRERHLLVGGERDGGLSVIMYVGDMMNFISEEDSLRYSKGFRAVIHEKGTRPEMLEGFYVQEHACTYVQLGYTEEVVLRKCAEEESLQPLEFVDRYGKVTQYRYSVRDCQVNLYQNFLNESCRCVSEILPLPAKFRNITRHNITFCHHINEERLKQSRGAKSNDSSSVREKQECHDNAINEIHKQVSAKKTKKDSYCPLKCNNTRYEMRVMQNKWPNDANETRQALWEATQRTMHEARSRGDSTEVLEEIMEHLKNDPYALQRFAKLTVYSHSTMGNIVRENWAYLARNLASDIGGILGLWLGVSIISTFEFFELFIQLFSVRRKENQQLQAASAADAELA